MCAVGTVSISKIMDICEIHVPDIWRNTMHRKIMLCETNSKHMHHNHTCPSGCQIIIEENYYNIVYVADAVCPVASSYPRDRIHWKCRPGTSPLFTAVGSTKPTTYQQQDQFCKSTFFTETPLRCAKSRGSFQKISEVYFDDTFRHLRNHRGQAQSCIIRFVFCL